MKNGITFGGQIMRQFESIGDILAVVVCPKDVNPIVNVFDAVGGPMPISFWGKES